MNKIDIINGSLRKLGVKTVTSENDASVPLQSALGAYPFVVDEVLRDYAWSFATKYSRFALVNTKPAFGYGYAFQLPADCVVVLDVRASTDLSDKEAHYAISGKQLYTNASKCYCRYISNSVNIQDYTVDFCNALATKLASEIALGVAQNPNAKQLLIQEYLLILDKAMLNDSRANNDITVDPEKSSDLLNARWEK